ncbi:probable receptor-like protein kinase At2g47060 [Andrographis paniculata]|uniref:probable receptor-like protein kinase At2g47060 n=1 Tax=Andrographis paniculata TaxID=175694 RepID=UPI0021E8EC05|nr:probable receptor-like protein kinase At2g47060 [Andrographis paniculata]
MGFSRNACQTKFLTSTDHEDSDEFDDQNDAVKFESFLYKMIWDFGLACAIPRRRQRTSGADDELNPKFDHNKAWLLAESGGCGGDEPYSGHSSFRFCLCSQVELESMAVHPTRSATVLMVNLDNGSLIDSNLRETKWKRLESLERSISPVAHSLVRFTYSQILSATRNFSKGRVLGRGALSCVFWGRVGFLKTAVAVKRLDKEDKESSKAFCRELMIASSLHNPHIVPLLGFCIDSDHGLFLVYRFVSGGSLDQFLHGKKKSGAAAALLTWQVRYRVAVGIAEAIEYLHNGTERCVVHRDIKPSNILLSSKKTPKLCDFGLATWTPAPSVPFLCKTVKGTFGYLAPEYFQHGKVSDKTDIYAFGVVLLELITGRKPIESRRGPGEENLVLWAKPLLQQGNVEKLLDSRLKLRRRNMSQVANMVRAATACIHNEESRRPDMAEIVAILRGKSGDGINRKKSLSSAAEHHNSQLQRTKSEMKSHFALAMLGVEFDEDTHLQCR